MEEEFNMAVAINQIQIDLASVKTDIVWLKRLLGAGLVVISAVFGIDMFGVV